MSKTYYKVVGKSLSGEFCSARAAGYSRDFKTVYVLNEWVSPRIRGSKLFVFDSLEKAKRFRDKYNSEHIFKVEVKSPSKQGIFSSNASWGELKECFKLRCRKKNYTAFLKSICCNDINSLPQGTIFADAVKLIKRIN